MRLTRAALAATILAAGLGTFAGTAHADSCNNEPATDKEYAINNVVRVGLDDGSAGLTGVVVVCVGVLGTPEFTQAGGGLHQESDGSYTIYVCLPDCQPIP